MELDRKQLQVSYASPQGWEAVESTKRPALQVKRYRFHLAEASILTFVPCSWRPRQAFSFIKRKTVRGRSVSIE